MLTELQRSRREDQALRVLGSGKVLELDAAESAGSAVGSGELRNADVQVLQPGAAEHHGAVLDTVLGSRHRVGYVGDHRVRSLTEQGRGVGVTAAGASPSRGGVPVGTGFQVTECGKRRGTRRSGGSEHAGGCCSPGSRVPSV